MAPSGQPLTQQLATSWRVQATYILVTRNGWLWAGTKNMPHPTGVSIKLDGTRQTPDFAIREDLNLGSKVRLLIVLL